LWFGIVDFLSNLPLIFSVLEYLSVSYQILRVAEMNENIIVLKRQDVEISRVQNPDDGRLLMILRYQGQVFRLMRQFGAGQKDRAKALCERLVESRGQRCVLLEQGPICSVWLETPSERRSEQVTATVSATPTSELSLAQVCLLIIQTIADDIEDLMGASQKRAFQEDMTKVFKQCLLPGANTPESINYLLTIDPLATTKLPIWEQKNMEMVFSRLARVGKKYFGNTTFVERTIDVLKELPIYSNPQFMYCCMQFVLLCKS
jgi:hypothetical protein